MNKSELLQKCKEMGIKGVSSKTKSEILLIIKERNNPKHLIKPLVNNFLS